MTCNEFESYCLRGDEETLATLRAHMDSCSECKSRLEEHEMLSVLAAGSRERVRSPSLWPRIEEALSSERKASLSSRPRMAVLALAAAAAVLLIALPPMFWLNHGRPVSLILDDAESSVINGEQERLEQELERLEPVFRQRIEQDGRSRNVLNVKMERLDSNIETCRRRYSRNRLNRGVMAALLGALLMKLNLIEEYVSR